MCKYKQQNTLTIPTLEEQLARTGLETLTSREKDCISLWILGHTMPVIGEILFISPRTVETHLYNARAKVLKKTRQALILWLIALDRYTDLMEHAMHLLKRHRRSQKACIPARETL